MIVERSTLLADLIPSNQNSQVTFPLLLGLKNLCQNLHTDLPAREHLRTIAF